MTLSLANEDIHLYKGLCVTLMLRMQVASSSCLKVFELNTEI